MASSNIVRLIARCRPCSEEKVWELATGNGLIKSSGTSGESYTLDVLLDDTTTHQMLFNKSLSDLVPKVAQGHSMTLIAYGPPCSGKTYTMFGTTGQSRVNQEARGVIARCGDLVLSELTQQPQSVSRVTASFCHIFQDGRVADLLDTKKRSLAIVEQGSRYCIEGATEQPVTSLQDIVRVVERGMLMRNATGCVRQTAGEKRFSIKHQSTSSQLHRAHTTHAVFQYNMEHMPNGPSSENVVTSCITIVDIAGQSVADADSGITALIGTLQQLNNSTTAAASEYCLSSALTKLLHASLLGATSHMVVFCTLALDSSSAELTHSSLEMMKQMRSCATNDDTIIPSILPRQQTKLGQIIAEIKRIREELAGKNGIDGMVTSWQTISATAIRVNGKLLAQLSPECVEIIRKLKSLEDQLIPKEQQGPPQRDTRPMSLPPIYQQQQQQARVTFVKPSSLVPSIPSSVHKLTRPSAALLTHRPDTSTDDSSSADGNSNDEYMPPLKDIPHIKLASPVGSPPPTIDHMWSQHNDDLHPLADISKQSMVSSSSSYANRPFTPKKTSQQTRRQHTAADSSSTTSASSEAEDYFNPDQQLPMHHTSVATRQPVGHLPPLVQAQQACVSSSLPPLPVLSAAAVTSVADTSASRPPSAMSYTQALPPQYIDDTSQYLSKEEIHLAAMEGVKVALLRTLVDEFGVDHRDSGGRTPLMYAVLGNQPRMCEELLNKHADVNVCDNTQNTPLIWAAFLARPDVMRILFRYGCDIQLADSAGRNALHWAMKTPLIQCLKLLCKHLRMGVENRPDHEGLSPLHWAVMCEQVDHIRYFLRIPSVDASVQDSKGRSPLVYAVLNYSPACIKAILDCRENVVNHRDGKGRTALHFACAESSADCVRTLLSFKKCNINCVDHRAASALHWAAAANQPGILQLLLRRGADRTATDENDMMAVDHARQRDHTQCIRILEEYGIRRQPSVWSIASQFAPQPATPPELDQHGHKLMKRPIAAAQQLFEGERLPADGHSHAGDHEEPGHEESTNSTDHQRRRGIRWMLLCGLCSTSDNRVAPL